MPVTLTLKHLFQIPQDKKRNCVGKTFVGIDFGTSTTVVSIASLSDKGDITTKTILLPQLDKNGTVIESDLCPSVIAHVNGRLLVGTGASRLKYNKDFVEGVNLWHSFKMGLGMDNGPLWPYRQCEDIKNHQDATCIFFKYLYARILQYCQKNGISKDIEFVVSVPASFESNQRRDLIEALAKNNIKISGQNLIDEPNAAFLGYITPSYDYKEEIKFNEEGIPKVLVFDFGAGTCDISILKLSADHKGLHTSNISISKFEELGGNNIDQYIVWRYLLPAFLRNNGKSKDDYLDKELEEIANRLMGIAEQLKIRANKALLYYYGESRNVYQAVENVNPIIFEDNLCIETGEDDLTQSKFELKLSDFLGIMDCVFYENKRTKLPKTERKKYLKSSIESVLQSALKKAGVKRGDIDYVMLIGGSSKSPYIQNELKNWFGRATHQLIAQNLQTLVSQGAAIHSLLLNGLEITAVKPIISESMYVIVRGEDPVPVVAAGTEIPFQKRVNYFSTGDYVLSTIEIPVFVSSKDKQLFNVKLNYPHGDAFPRNSQIELILEINNDKVLHAKASCRGIESRVVLENPFANGSLTDAEVKVEKAKREANISADNNDGIASRKALRNLRNAYEEADDDYSAAETLAEELKYYPNEELYNLAGVLYHNGGNRKKSIPFYKKAIEYNPNVSIYHSNLGDDYFWIGETDKAIEELQKALDLDLDNTTALIRLGDIHKECGENTQAEELYRRAYNIFMRRRTNRCLSATDYSWAINLAYKLGEYEMERTLTEEQPNRESEEWYNKDNLASFDHTIN